MKDIYRMRGLFGATTRSVLMGSAVGAALATASIDQACADVTFTGDIGGDSTVPIIGDFANGGLVVDDGSVFASTGAFIANQVDATGVVSVHNPSSLWNVGTGENAFIEIGRSNGSGGVLFVSDGGRVRVANGPEGGPMGVTVALAEGSTGNLTVDGVGSRLEIESNGTGATPGLGTGAGLGQIRVAHGAIVTIDTGTSEFGGFSLGGSKFFGEETATGTGIGTVTGAGSTLSLTGDSPGISVGLFGYGSLVVENAGRVETLGVEVGVAGGSQGLLLLDTGGSVDLVGADTLSGAAPSMIVGREVGSEGRIVVRDGTVSIDGTAAPLADLSIGGSFDGVPGGTGEVTVGGSSARIEMTGDTPIIQVGNNGDGTLAILDGGAVTGATYFAVGMQSRSIGNFILDAGTLELMGTGSAAASAASGLDLEGFGASFQVGAGGIGVARVLNGGRVDIDAGPVADGDTGSTITVGGGADAAAAFTGGGGKLVLTDFGSEIVAKGADAKLVVGVAGSDGELQVLSGARVVLENPDGQARGYVGAEAGSTGTVLVDGDGSELDAGGLLALGLDAELQNAGTGKLTVTDGGLVTADRLLIGAGGFLGGTGTVKGDVSHIGGVLAPGSSPGTLTIDGMFEMTSGILTIEVEGLSAGEFDMLVVTGDASFTGGTIEFAFKDFLPELGDSIEFLSASNLTAFENVDFVFTGVAPSFLFDVDFDLGGGGGLTFVAQSDAVGVPEPSGLVVVSTALIGLGFVRRRRDRECSAAIGTGRP